VSVSSMRLAVRVPNPAHALAHVSPRSALSAARHTNSLTLTPSPTRVCSRSEQVQGQGVQVTKSPKGAIRQPRAGPLGGPQFPDRL
jgi:hypothetical protein